MLSSFKYLLVFLFLTSCSTSNKIEKLIVYQSAIFTKQEFVGNITVDDNNNPLQKGYWLQHLIVIEVSNSSLPKWENLMINDQENQINFSSIQDSIFNIGKEKMTSNIINIYPKNGGKLFLLKVEDFSTELPLSKTQFILNGKVGEKSCQIKLNKEPILLETEARP